MNGARDRILARRAHFVAIALSACGARTQPVVTVGGPIAASSVDAAADPVPRPQMCLSVSMRPRIAQRIAFASNQSALEPSAEPILDEIVAFLQGNPQYRLRVRGHIDNIELPAVAEARATVVRAYIEKHGIDGARLEQTTLGSGLPLVSNSTEEGRAQNRRVDFELLE